MRSITLEGFAIYIQKVFRRMIGEPCCSRSSNIIMTYENTGEDR